MNYKYLIQAIAFAVVIVSLLLAFAAIIVMCMQEYAILAIICVYAIIGFAYQFYTAQVEEEQKRKEENK